MSLLSDVERLVDSYCRAWFALDPEERGNLLSQCVEQDVIYVDPRAHIVGIRSLSSHIDRIMASRPGFWLERTTVVDVHHDFVRFGWVQRGADGFRGAESIDMCRVSANGKLSLIVGFFGPLAPADRVGI